MLIRAVWTDDPRAFFAFDFLDIVRTLVAADLGPVEHRLVGSQRDGRDPHELPRRGPGGRRGRWTTPPPGELDRRFPVAHVDGLEVRATFESWDRVAFGS